jgi:hypothetical protein
MKCEIIDTPAEAKKAEVVVNEWLAAHSHLNIKLVQETIIGQWTVRISFYYEE